MKEWFKTNGLKLMLGLFTLIGGLNLAEIYKTNKDFELEDNKRESLTNKELSREFLKLKDEFNAYKILKEREINELQNEISRLKNNVILLEFAGKDIPTWVKDRNNIVVGVSEAYKKYILDPEGVKPEDFIGTTGKGTFPDYVVDKWIVDDNLVLASNESHATIEPIPNGRKGLSLKSPLNTSYNGVIGTSGAWIDKKYLRALDSLGDGVYWIDQEMLDDLNEKELKIFKQVFK